MIMTTEQPELAQQQTGYSFKTVGADGKERTWEVRADGQVKQVKPGKGEPGSEEEAPPEATQLPS
jgi:hypothetical protein